MKSLDRLMKRERNKRYRILKRIFKARDAASKYVEMDIRISMVLNNISIERVKQLSNTQLAKLMIDASWAKPSAPLPRKTKLSITKL